MRTFVLGLLTLASVAAIATDASAFGKKRGRKSASASCCPAPAPVAPCDPCGGTGYGAPAGAYYHGGQGAYGAYPPYPSGPMVMPGAYPPGTVIPGTMPLKK